MQFVLRIAYDREQIVERGHRIETLSRHHTQACRGHDGGEGSKVVCARSTRCSRISVSDLIGAAGLSAAATCAPNSLLSHVRDKLTARERFNPMSPLDYLLSVIRDSQNELHVRLHAAAKAAPYVRPRLSSVALAPRSLDEVGHETCCTAGFRSFL